MEYAPFFLMIKVAETKEVIQRFFITHWIILFIDNLQTFVEMLSPLEASMLLCREFMEAAELGSWLFLDVTRFVDENSFLLLAPERLFLGQKREPREETEDELLIFCCVFGPVNAVAPLLKVDAAVLFV